MSVFLYVFCRTDVEHATIVRTGADMPQNPGRTCTRPLNLEALNKQKAKCP